MPPYLFQTEGYTVKTILVVLLLFTLNAWGVSLEDWGDLKARLKDAPQRLQVINTNTFFNQVPYKSDLFLWAKEDYWTLPEELLLKGAGDCEDVALAKYETLRQIGIKDDHLFLVYGIETKVEVPHMVLIWIPEPGAEPLMLDSLHTAVMPVSQRSSFVPVYAFNEEVLFWIHDWRTFEYLGTPTTVPHWDEYRATRALWNSHW